MQISNTLFRSLAPVAFALLPLAAHAQTTDELAEIVEPEASSGAYMGAVLVAKGDEVLLNHAWGSANLEWQIANTNETRFRIGSVTKQFTAVSILLLQERGMLSVKAPISQYLDDTPEAWNAITVHDLLQHTSGISNVTSLDEFGTRKFLPTTQDELIAMFADLPLEFEPGSKWAYSNSNFVLLSRIVENVSQQNYSEFIEANLLEPLEMQSTGIDRSASILQRRASGYSPSQHGIVNADYVNMAIPTGAGALYSTTGDLLKWHRGLFGGALLNEESLSQLTTPSEHDAVQGARYAMGLLVTDSPEGPVIWHGGGIEGFNAFLGYDQNTQTSVVVLANLNGGSAARLGMELLKTIRE
ncbi:serine hydrolase domain-containing protein [Erythrobacter sp. W53]|uniref:serine hydrolase domain-containing protein n=1 Tax=Erythrobacter sp. W53 TaxID=3425947 RepID=UPI003D766CF1